MTRWFLLSLGLASLLLPPPALAGKPQPPPPTPPADPAITWWRDDDSIMIANDDGSDPYVLLGPINVKNGPASYHRFPAWSVDGQWIVFGSDMPVKPTDHPELNATGTGLYMIRADGSFLCKITSTPDNLIDAEWSPAIPPGAASYKIAYAVQLGPSPCPSGCLQLPCCQNDVFLVDAECDAAPPVNVTRTEGETEIHPTWSPDASRFAVAYQNILETPGSDVDSLAIYALNPAGDFAALEAKLGYPPGNTLVMSPEWSRGGTRIAVRAGGIWTYELDTGGWFEIVVPVAGETSYWPTWSPDDSRILFEHNLRDLWIADSVPGASPSYFLGVSGRRAPAYRFPQWRRF